MASKQIETAALILLTTLASSVARAQTPTGLDLGGSIEVGGEAERYARVLQISGLTPLTPWSIQPFSPRQNERMRISGDHPWALRYAAAVDSSGSASGRILRAKARVIDNSTFPFQDGGGPTWAGRGLTGEIQAGIAGSWRAFHVQLAPLAFAAQNTAFPLVPNGLSGTLAFGDARYPTNIDLPQRFGNRVYDRLDLGTSSVTVDAFHVAGGLSSAPQRWGPEREYPLVLGPNAGGFPMAFAGTDEPVNLWLFKVHGRVVYGYLSQSAYVGVVDDVRHRLGSGSVITILPRGATGLEIGLARFSHEPWTGMPSPSQLARPFSPSLASSGTNPVNINEMGSLFARWALPGAKAEFYGEFYKEDFVGRFHESISLVEEPDDLSSYAFGFQKVLSASGARIRVLRAELVNGETSHQERGTRGFTAPNPPYIHGYDVYQGHTENGLLLGSPQAYGGAGWRFGLDNYTRKGRMSLTLERSLQLDWLPTMPTANTWPDPDVVYDVRAELLRFAGPRDIGLTLIPAIDLNRGLVSKHNVFNLLTELTVHGW